MFDFFVDFVLLGPVVLAVGYTLLLSWLAEDSLRQDEIPLRRRR